MAVNYSANGKLGYEKTREQLLAHNTRRSEVARERHSGKICLNCSEPLPYEKRRNKFCSHSCAATLNNFGRHRRPKEEKWCPSCGARILRNDKVYCSQKCCQRFQQDSYIERWLAGAEDGGQKCGASHRVKRWLLETKGKRCEECGWGEKNPYSGKMPLEVEHVDGDFRNNRPENLKVLCPNCHSLTPTYKNMNKGNGRPNRRITR